MLKWTCDKIHKNKIKVGKIRKYTETPRIEDKIKTIFLNRGLTWGGHA